MNRALAVVLIAVASVAGLFAWSHARQSERIRLIEETAAPEPATDGDLPDRSPTSPSATPQTVDPAALQELDAATLAVEEAEAEVRKIDRELAKLYSRKDDLDRQEIRANAAELESGLTGEDRVRPRFVRASLAQLSIDMDVLEVNSLTARAALRDAVSRRQAALSAMGQKGY